jgi:hypothetical protein
MTLHAAPLVRPRSPGHFLSSRRLSGPPRTSATLLLLGALLTGAGCSHTPGAPDPMTARCGDRADFRAAASAHRGVVTREQLAAEVAAARKRGELDPVCFESQP